MPKDRTIQKVLVIGSGPIVIGQATEFDYAGARACAAVVAAVENGYYEKGMDITVKLRGGDLTVNYSGGRITLHGSAVLVYEGVFEY